MSLIDDLIREINSKLAGSDYIITEQPREEYWIKQYSVLINGYLYMSIFNYLYGIPFMVRRYDNPYQIPIYSVTIESEKHISCYCRREKKVVNFHSISDVIRNCFSFPDKMDNDKLQICKSLNLVFESTIDPSNIGFDLYTQTYFTVDWNNDNGFVSFPFLGQ